MFSCKDQGNEKKEAISYLVKAKEIPINKEIRALIPNEYDKVITETIDFDNDSKKDYICTVYDSKKQANIEYWITSDYKLLFQNEFSESMNYKFFINLDNDNLMELFRCSGEEDGIDYAFYDIKNNKLEPLLYFTPILIDDSKPNNYYYGYAWDISEIVISDNKLLSAITINDSIERDGNIQMPKNQRFLPIIFFKGKTTQPEIKYNKTFKKNYYSLEKIRNSVKVKDNQHLKTITSLKSELANYKIKKEVKCDLNKDKKEDLILFFEPKEIKNLGEYDSYLLNSPVYVLINAGQDKFVVSKNDKIIYTLSFNCPDDGLKKVVVRDNSFLIEQNTCDEFGNFQNDNITFEYNLETKSITLEKFKRDYFERKDHSEMLPLSTMVSSKNFGKVFFEDYDSRKQYDKIK